MPRPRRKLKALSVVVVVGAASALACSGPMSYDSATGCCVIPAGNGTKTEWVDCPDTSDHPDAECCYNAEDSCANTDSAANTDDSATGQDSGGDSAAARPAAP